MKTSLPLLILLTLGLALKAEPIPLPRIKLDLTHLIPNGWVVSQIDTQAVPYPSLIDGKSGGFGVTIEGPTMTKGGKGESARESLTLWFMPADFVLANPTPSDAPLTPSAFLGCIPSGARVYVKDWTPIPSWPEWRKTLIKALQIMQP